MGRGLRNIGLEDALIRIIVGFIFIYLGVQYASWVYYSLAIILVTTAIVGFCPFYVLFSINTNRRAKIGRISKDEIKKAVEGKIEEKGTRKEKSSSSSKKVMKIEKTNKKNKTTKKNEKKESKKKTTKKKEGTKKSSKTKGKKTTKSGTKSKKK